MIVFFGVHDISQVIFKRIPVVIEYPNTDMRKFYLSSVADGVRKDVTSVFENLPISLWSTADTVFERDDVIAFNTGTSIPEKPQIIVLQIRDILGRIDGVNYYMRYAAHPCTMYLGGDVVRTLVERLGLDVVVEVVKVKDIDIDIEKSGVWSAKNQRLREEKNKEDLKRLEKNSPIVFG